MIQPLSLNNIGQTIPELHQIGCIGKIISFKETENGDYLIELKG
jgi:Lon protease-like protein